jgi:cytoskeletal protein CcmA (bactofilin family)
MKGDASISAFFGADVELEGNLKFRGTVNLEGRFKGEISAAGTLIVGDQATVEAEIHVSTIIVMGVIIGNIKAEKKIELHATANVNGDIQAPVVEIHPGAALQGQCLTRTVPPAERVSGVATNSEEAN